MQIFVNGEEREVSGSETLASLLAELGLDPKHLAVEVNLELVPRGEHASCLLNAGDRLEIVTLVGGG
jgi:sulfur carrier protein